MKVDTEIEILRSRDALVKIGYRLDDVRITALFNTAIEALQKQIPKGYDMTDDGTIICQICHKPITKKLYPKYCGYCGQAIDWVEVKE